MLKPFRVLFILMLSLSAAQAQQARKYSNEFLSIGVGARAFGMSNSVVATTGDATSGYWNPAGLMDVKDKLQVSVMHSVYFAGIGNYDFASMAAPVSDKGVIGFSFNRFGVDDIVNTLDLIQNGQVDYNRIKTFSATDYAFYTSYAHRLSGKSSDSSGFYLGGSAKIVHRKVGSFATAWGYGLDIGAKYRMKNWTFGLMAKDISTTYNIWKFTFTEAEKNVFYQTNNEIPISSVEITLPKLILGAAHSFRVGEKNTLLAELDMDFAFDGQRNTIANIYKMSVDPHFGLEMNFQGVVYIRGGVGNLQNYYDVSRNGNSRITTVQPNIGIGLRIKNLLIDYALSDLGDLSTALYSNVFSLRIALNPANKK